MLYYSMSFVSLDADVVDVVDAGSLGHCCCNVFDDLVNGDDESSYLESYFKDYTKVTQKAKGRVDVESRCARGFDALADGGRKKLLYSNKK